MSNVKFTKVDHMILQSYIKVCEGLANYLSSAYEVVLHSLENYEKSVICIYNGEHTNRKVGAPITNLALSMLEKIEDGMDDTMVYFSKNKNGEPLKSTTIAIRGEGNKIIGLICINFYMNIGFVDYLKSYLPIPKVQEDYAQNSDEMIMNTYQKIREEVISDASILASNKNKVIIERMYEMGIFNLKEAMPIVERIMGLSKNTIYLHIRNYKKKQRDE